MDSDVRRRWLSWLGCVLCVLATVAFVLLVPGTLSILVNAMPRQRFHYYYVEDLRTGSQIAGMLIGSGAIAVLGAFMAVRNRRRQS